MKKIISLLLSGVFCLSVTSLTAQTETDSSFRSSMNYIFENVDKSKVPYGILRDYAMEFTNLENFNGTAALADSNYTTPSVFWEVYNTLLMGRVHTSATGFLKQDTVDNRWYSYRQPGRITLSGLYFSYSRFKDNAANNYITITNNRLYDMYVSGVWQNPYQTETAFVISPSVTIYNGTGFTILLPVNTWLTNSSTALSGISIDVGDGTGYRTLNPGVSLSVNYTAPGTYEWKYRVALIAGGYHYAHSQVTINGTSN